jgi:mRNA-degrading endonuclease toxin of MazEF toxin-antitoxin module
MKIPKRFEVWFVNWNLRRGSEQEGLRPSLIIQTDAENTNQNYPNTIVIAMS